VSSPKLEACAHLPFGSDSAAWWNVGGHLLQCCSALRAFNKPGCFWCLLLHHAALRTSPVWQRQHAAVCALDEPHHTGFHAVACSAAVRAP